jgi:hypothetical protein
MAQSGEHLNEHQGSQLPTREQYQATEEELRTRTFGAPLQEAGKPRSSRK